MANNLGQFPKKDFIPPNLVAFLAGVLLALVVGFVFRKIIDKISPQRPIAAMRAQPAADVPAQKVNLTETSQLSPKSLPEAGEEKDADHLKAEVTPAAQPVPLTASDPEREPKAAKAETGQPQTAKTETAESETELTTTGEVDYLAWRKTLKELEDTLRQQKIPVNSVTLTPRYRHQAKGLAITRGQFLDVVSRKVPANLPTRKNNLGLVLHALGTSDFNPELFAKAAGDSGTRLEALCQAGKSRHASESNERITVIVSNTPAFYKCLQDWLATNPLGKNITELSLIGFTRGSTFFGSITAEKRLVSLQMWNPDWLTDNTVAIDETGRESVIHKRSLRLANVTRALGQPSDVRMQIPASTRSLNGPLVEPKDPTPAKPLFIGNFALVPSHMPRGALIATALAPLHKGQGKTVTVTPPGPGRAKALVLASKGQQLQFMTVTRE